MKVKREIVKSVSAASSSCSPFVSFLFARHLHPPFDFDAIDPDTVRPDQFMNASLPDGFFRIGPLLVFSPALTDLISEQPG